MAASMNGPMVATTPEKDSFSSEKVNQICSHNESFENDPSTELQEIKDAWGFDLNELYKLAITFLKEKEGKALHLSYQDKISLVAFTQQVSHGQFKPESSPPIGYLDVIGRDRRQAWSTLSDMSKEDAMLGYINRLDSICPLFKPYVQAHKCDLEEKERLEKEAEEQKRLEEEEKERQRLEDETRLQEEKERHRQTQQKRLIQEALNRQTYHQFKAYAEQQYAGNPEQQAVLIRQLQEQHYQQYMQQVLQHQLLKNQNNTNLNNHQNNMASDVESKHKVEEQPAESSGGDTSEEESDMPPVAAANMWTRKDVKEFKDSIRKQGGDGIIKVGHGETVTVRVPTHEDGFCLFWEFATDSYDIGFGVYFEWTKNPDSQVSVHISESEDEEEEDEEEINQTPGDIEKGVPQSDHPPVSVIIPVYRRDCHEEVYAGSHMYPGQGVYLLKFDNSYSLWRSKTLFYRVYYTRE